MKLAASACQKDILSLGHLCVRDILVSFARIPVAIV